MWTFLWSCDLVEEESGVYEGQGEWTENFPFRPTGHVRTGRTSGVGVRDRGRIGGWEAPVPSFISTFPTLYPRSRPG